MADPTLSIALDKSTYAPGETMTLTATYGDPDNKPVTVEVKVTDSEGNEVLSAVTGAVLDPLILMVTDPDRAWTEVSNNGTVAVYQSIA